MEANYGKSWSEKEDQYLFSIFKDFPLTNRGNLSTKSYLARILVSNMAFRFKRTESEIKKRVNSLFYSSSIKMVYTIDINDVYTKALMEGNYGKRWLEEEDRYLFSVFKDYPLTKKGYLSTENGVGIIVSIMAFHFRRTECAIKKRVIKLKNKHQSNTNDSLLALEQNCERVSERGVLIDRILDILDVKMKLICDIVQK